MGVVSLARGGREEMPTVAIAIHFEQIAYTFPTMGGSSSIAPKYLGRTPIIDPEYWTAFERRGSEPICQEKFERPLDEPVPSCGQVWVFAIPRLSTCDSPGNHERNGAETPTS